MNHTHTAGPWEVGFDRQNRPRVYAGGSEIVRALSEHGLRRLPKAERDANRHLIAAAPELLEALVEILGPLNVCSDNPNVRDDVSLPIDMTMGELRKARAAIRKALRATSETSSVEGR